MAANFENISGRFRLNIF